MKLGQIFILYTKYSKFNKQYNNIMSTGSFENKSQQKLDSLVAYICSWTAYTCTVYFTYPYTITPCCRKK